MWHLPTLLRAVLVLGLAWTGGFAGATAARADEATVAKNTARPKRVLLIGQKPDGHPFATHEYMPGMVLLAKLLQPVEGVQTIVEQADGAWERGPELLDGADAAVLFVSEGAKWIHGDPERLAAFRRLAERGGGLVCWHWGMGCKDAEYIDGFVELFGGCHGGPDRRYKVVTATARPVEQPHPILRGVGPLRVHEEFYYRLKFPKQGLAVTPLVRVEIEDEPHTVSWAWERPGGGRSFGFSGGHFHENWKHSEYRRLAVQGVLWTLKLPIPEDGRPVDVTDADLKLKPRENAN